ncbi:MAG: histone deacetylase, partial [Candidatus Binatia bacterium]
LLLTLLAPFSVGLLAAEVELEPTGARSTDAPTALVYHPDYLLHNPGSGHPERPERLRAIMAHLERQGLLDALLRLQPEMASESWLTRVHTPTYLNLLEKAVRTAPVALDPDTIVSAQSYRVARLAVGGVLLAVDAVIEGRARNAFAAVRPPGHHALPDRAMGFCLLNSVAIATRYVQKKHRLKRVLIVDWDVHHGNSTQDIFYSDPSVLYFSTHQYPFYPGTGSEQEKGQGPGHGMNINVPLPAGSGDRAVISAFREKLVPAAEAFKPEFVLISAGFDGHQRDPLAQFQLTEDGYAALTRIVKEIAERFAGGRLVSMLEGGYDLEALSRSVEAHLRVLQTRSRGRVK